MHWTDEGNQEGMAMGDPFCRILTLTLMNGQSPNDTFQTRCSIQVKTKEIKSVDENLDQSLPFKP